MFTNAAFFTLDEKEKKEKKYKTKPKKSIFLSIMIQMKLEKQTAADKVSSDCFFP